MKDHLILFDLSKRFIEETKGNWNSDQWQGFIEELSSNGINVNVFELQQLLMRERDRFFTVSDILSNFVAENDGQWDHSMWMALHNDVKSRGHDYAEHELGMRLESERARYAAEKQRKLAALAKDFVEKNDGSWDHAKWLDLQEKARGIVKFRPHELGEALEAQKRAYFEKKMVKDMTGKKSSDSSSRVKGYRLKSRKIVARKAPKPVPRAAKRLAEMSKKEKEIEHKLKQLLRREEEIESIKVGIDIQRKQIQDEWSRISQSKKELEGKVEELRKQEEHTKHYFLRIEEENKSIIEQSETLKTVALKLGARKEALDRRFKTLIKERLHHEKEVPRLQKEIKDLEATLQKKRDEIARLEHMHKDNDGKLRELEAMQKRIVEDEAKKAKTIDMLHNVERDLIIREQEIDKKLSVLLEKEQDVIKKERAIATHEMDLSKKVTAVTQKEAEIRTMIEQLDSKQADLKTEKSTLQGRIDSLKEQELKLKHLNDELKAESAKIKETDKKIEEKTKILKDLESKILKKEEELHKETQLVKDERALLEKEQKRLDSLMQKEKALLEREKAAKDKEEEASRLMKEYEAKTREISKEKEKIDKEFAHLTKREGELSEREKNLKERESDVEKESKRHVLSRKEVEEKLAIAHRKEVGLRQEMQKLEKMQDEVHSDLEEKRKLVKEETQRLTSIQKEAAHLKDRMDKDLAELVLRKKQIEDKERDLHWSKNEVLLAKKHIADIKKEYLKLVRVLYERHRKVAEYETSISRLKEFVSQDMREHAKN